MEEAIKDFFGALPEGFVAKALTLTSPQEASILSLVNSFFRVAANSDSVWKSFTPKEYVAEAQAVVGGHVSKKEVYLYLCDHPVIIDEGKKSFWLDKRTGKKCYMLAAKGLSINLSDSAGCWRWTWIPESRFLEVIDLMNVRFLHVSGKINTSILSRETTYVAHLVFKMSKDAYGFEYQPVEVRIGTQMDKCQTRMVYLDPEAGQRRRLQPRTRDGIFKLGALPTYDPPSMENGPKHRNDGWFEVEIGEYYNDGENEMELEMSVIEAKGNKKAGLIIQGIEIRPKNCAT